MASRPILISNNPTWQNAAPANIEFQFVEGCVLDVLTMARDLAHKGWTLANHPLYGNFTPHQQPYRSLVLLPPVKKAVNFIEEPCPPLSLLEGAISLYQNSTRKSNPEDVPEHMRKDCALIDRELMRATLASLS